MENRPVEWLFVWLILFLVMTVKNLSVIYHVSKLTVVHKDVKVMLQRELRLYINHCHQILYKIVKVYALTSLDLACPLYLKIGDL